MYVDYAKAPLMSSNILGCRVVFTEHVSERQLLDVLWRIVNFRNEGHKKRERENKTYVCCVCSWPLYQDTAWLSFQNYFGSNLHHMGPLSSAHSDMSIAMISVPFQSFSLSISFTLFIPHLFIRTASLLPPVHLWCTSLNYGGNQSTLRKPH